MSFGATYTRQHRITNHLESPLSTNNSRQPISPVQAISVLTELERLISLIDYRTVS